LRRAHQDLDRRFSEVTGDLQPCACATALCGALELGTLWQRCKRNVLDGLLHPDVAGAPEAPEVSEDGVLTVCISVCGEPVLAVRLADSSWGLVTGYDLPVAGHLRCLLCRKRHCPHTNALDDGEGRALGHAQSGRRRRPHRQGQVVRVHNGGVGQVRLRPRARRREMARP